MNAGARMAILVFWWILLAAAPARAQTASLPYDVQDTPISEDLNFLANQVRAANASISAAATTSTNTYTQTQTFNGNVIINSSLTINGSNITGLWQAIYVATQTITLSGTSTSANFTVTAAAFQPALPAGITKVPFVICYPAEFHTNTIGGNAAAPGFSSATGSPFNGSSPRDGVYTNVSLNDVIKVTIEGNTAGGGSGSMTWLFIALL